MLTSLDGVVAAYEGRSNSGHSGQGLAGGYARKGAQVRRGQAVAADDG